MNAGGISMAVVALILLRLHARPDEWVAVPALAQHMALAQAVVRLHLEHMTTAGVVRVQRDEPDVGLISAARIHPEARG